MFGEFAETVRDVGGTELSEAEEARRQELHAAAVDYWKLGFRIIPLHHVTDLDLCSCGKKTCGSPGKHPMFKNWQVPDHDPDSDATWWRRLAQGETRPLNWEPLANVGILTGETSGVIVIDQDEGGEATLSRLEAEHPDELLPATLIVRTGKGGRHFYFRWPGFKIANGKPWGKHSGVDLKADRGYVVAPPSISGFGPYEHIQNVTDLSQVAEAPSWVMEALRREEALQAGEPVGMDHVLPDALLSSYVRSALAKEAGIMRNTPKGNRNNQLNTSAFSLGTLGAHGLIFEAEARSALEAAALASGLEMSRIRATFLSGWRAGLEEPRDLSQVGELKDHEWPKLPWDDFGLGDRLVSRKGDVLRYVESWNSWMHCLNGCWQRCTEATPEMMAQWLIRRMFEEEKEQYSTEKTDPEKPSPRDRFRAWVRGCRTRAKVANCAKLARDHPSIRATDSSFDDYPLLLNCANGIIDLAKGELGEHDPSKMMTHQAPVSFNPRLMEDPLAHAPRWKAFLERCQPDPEHRAYLQRVAGYSLTGQITEQVMFVHVGSGANGKSVFHDAVAHVLGSYSQATPVETLTVKRSDGGVPNDIARMLGKRYLLASEAKEGKKLDWPLLKQLIGGDTIAARHMRAEFFEFSIIGKIHLTANEKPPINNDDPAIWRRLKLFPWPVTIPEDERDGLLPERLRGEYPAILCWLVQGAVEWKKNGLRTPEDIKSEEKAYRQEEDVISPLIPSVLVPVHPPAPPGTVGHNIHELYSMALFAWKQRGADVVGQRKFTTRLLKMGFTRVKSNGETYITDLRASIPGDYSS